MNERQRLWRLAGRYSALGVEMTVAIGVSAYAGSWLDNQFDTSPYLFFFGFIVGMGAAMKAIQRIIKEAKRRSH